MIRAPSRVLSRSEIASVLSKPTWTVHDLVDHSAALKNPPTDEDVGRIAKLAALDKPSPEMVRSFLNQLKFVEVLRDVDTTNVEPVVRLVDPVEVPDLESMADPGNAPEIGKWKPVSLAAEKESDFYVVKDSLHDEH